MLKINRLHIILLLNDIFRYFLLSDYLGRNIFGFHENIDETLHYPRLTIINTMQVLILARWQCSCYIKVYRLLFMSPKSQMQIDIERTISIERICLIKELFSLYGRIENIHIINSTMTSLSKGRSTSTTVRCEMDREHVK